MTTYNIGQSGQTIHFLSTVIDHFARHQQKRFFQREAGGQLFATFSESTITIVEATGPRKSDKRSRCFYAPDRKAEQTEILTRHALGLHFVGDWHTHPVRYPRPSSQDISSIGETVRRSRHSLNAFILVVVGKGPLPAHMYVGLHDGTHQYDLVDSQQSSL